MSGSVLDVLYTLRLVHHKSYPIDIYLPHFTDEKNEVPDFSQLFPELYAPRCPGLLLTLCAHRGILHFHLDHSSLITFTVYLTMPEDCPAPCSALFICLTEL